MSEIIFQSIGDVIHIEALALTIAENGVSAVVGGHHDVATVKVEYIQGVGPCFADLGIGERQRGGLLAHGVVDELLAAVHSPVHVDGSGKGGSDSDGHHQSQE